MWGSLGPSIASRRSGQKHGSREPTKSKSGIEEGAESPALESYRDIVMETKQTKPWKQENHAFHFPSSWIELAGWWHDSRSIYITHEMQQQQRVTDIPL